MIEAYLGRVMLAVQNLEVGYGHIQALKGVD